jgi:hypothetical protein
MSKVQSWSDRELEEYCKLIKVPTEWFVEVNEILIKYSGGMDKWYIREQHAVDEIVRFMRIQFEELNERKK